MTPGLNGENLSVLCNGPGCGPRGGDPFPLIIPFQLGSRFQLNYSGNLTADGDGNEGEGVYRLGLNYQFRLLESDRVTPVLVSETPEPATWGLLLGGLILSLGLRRARGKA